MMPMLSDSPQNKYSTDYKSMSLRGSHTKKTPAYVGLKSQLVRLNVGTRVFFIS